MNSLITFDHVSKRYRRYASRSFRDALSRAFRRCFSRSSFEPEDEWLWAVRDLTFDVNRGQTLGLIGPNGAGKTTALKLLSRITQPTSGRIRVNGRVSALIELGAGFHPELTGRENIYLNGTILGMSRREIAARFDDIVEFSELERFIDTPVKFYSSGMYARLGFSVAAHTNPDVLLVDEVLAVGDYAFQQRCYRRMRSLQKDGTTILLVSHNFNAISDICEEVVVLDRGKSVFQGPTPQALAKYSDLIRMSSVAKSSISVGQDGIAQRLMTRSAQIVHVLLVDHVGRPTQIVSPGDWVTLRVDIQFYEDAPHPVFACFVRDQRGQLVYDYTTSYQGVTTPSFIRGERATVEFKLQMNVLEGIYQIGTDLAYQDLTCYYDRMESVASLVVLGGKGAKGIVDLRCSIHLPYRHSCEISTIT